MLNGCAMNEGCEAVLIAAGALSISPLDLLYRLSMRRRHRHSQCIGHAPVKSFPKTMIYERGSSTNT